MAFPKDQRSAQGRQLSGLATLVLHGLALLAILGPTRPVERTSAQIHRAASGADAPAQGAATLKILAPALSPLVQASTHWAAPHWLPSLQPAAQEGKRAIVLAQWQKQAQTWAQSTIETLTLPAQLAEDIPVPEVLSELPGAQVKARVWVDAEGRATQVLLLTLQDDPLLDELIESLLRRARYMPALEHGKLVPSVITVELVDTPLEPSSEKRLDPLAQKTQPDQ